jgi:hypothetical protein
MRPIEACAAREFFFFLSLRRLVCTPSPRVFSATTAFFEVDGPAAIQRASQEKAAFVCYQVVSITAPDC